MAKNKKTNSLSFDDATSHRIDFIAASEGINKSLAARKLIAWGFFHYQHIAGQGTEHPSDAPTIPIPLVTAEILDLSKRGEK